MLVQLSKLKELKFSRGPHAFKRHGLLIFNRPQVLPFVTRISGAFFNVTQNLDDEKPGTRMEEAGLQSPKKGTSFPEENKGSVSAEDSCEKNIRWEIP